MDFVKVLLAELVTGFSSLSSETNLHDVRRRLQNSPSYVDFVVVMGLGIILFYLLRVLQRISNSWREMMHHRIELALEKRKLVKDPFRNTNGYSWDYVMVFQVKPIEMKMSKIQEERSLKFIIGRLADAGLQTKLFYSVQHDEIYVKIRAPLRRLLKEADRINYRLLLEPTILGGILREGNGKGPIEKQWKPVEVPSSTIETDIDPYDYIYCDYRSSDTRDMYKKYNNGTVLRGVDRLKLIAGIIAARLNEGGCHLDVYRLIKNKNMMTFFPLHDAVELRELEEKWLRLCQPPWLQHTDSVKDYFGEKTALYFLWLGHYTTWLISAAFLGFLAWIWVAADDNNPSAPIVPYFAAFIAVWSTLFLEFWKRKQAYATMKWGTYGFEEEEQVR
jgi:hypothetical protein